jgi:phosphatidylserine decarboxylase
MVMELLYPIVALIVTFVVATGIWFLASFNRDPERNPPAKDNVIVSPADGRIIYVERFESGCIPAPRKFGKEIHLKELVDLNAFPNGGHLIGIYLSPFDVHVVRAPVAGRVVFTSHWSGHFFSKEWSAFKWITDERRTSIIEGKDTRVGVVQMAAYLVRRVILYVRINRTVKLGERIGKIKLGSQVDLILANEAGLNIVAECGSKVRAGESVVAVFKQVSLA